MDDGEAFLRDPEGGPARARDDLAEELAEEFLSSATSAQEVGEEARDELFLEEIGGPFIASRLSTEIAFDRDSMNPDDAAVEPLPAPMRSYDERAARAPAVTEELPTSRRRARPSHP